MDRIYNTESFDNDSKLSNKHELIDVLKDCRIWDFRLYDAIVEPHRIDTMVHELVHITQHSKQSGIRNVKGKPVFGTEYRSKVEPNLAKFYNAIRNVSDGTATPEDYKIYTSSLQEIPAHAHNAAIDIFRAIDFDWSGKVDNYTQKQLHTLVAVIKQLPRGPSTIVDDNGRLIDSPRLDHYNTAFNHPEDKKLYQVYKRFIKILHQELVNYAQYWINKLKEVEDYK
jgi:ribosomal protein S13